MYNRVVIDPLNLTDETSQVLHKYLRRWRHNGLLVKRDTVLLSGVLSSFTLTHDLYVTEIIPGKWRYEVFANEYLGVGGSGTVYRTLGVILDSSLHDFSSLFVTHKQKRVGKSQPRDAWHEYSILKRCHYLHPRPLLAGIPSILSMVEIPGKLLIDALNEERLRQPFSLHERYALPYKLLRALKKLHDLQICHNDLTPRNIKYDSVTRKKITIFDFGTSKLVNYKNDLRSRGNAIYAAPEEFISERSMHPVSELGCDERDNLQSHTTQQSDIFSLGLILHLVWRGDDPLFADKSDVSSIIKKRAHLGWKVEMELFNGVRGLSDIEKDSIRDFLSDMVKLQPDARPDINRCIAVYSNIYLKYKLKHIPDDAHGMVVSAHYFAASLLRELDKIEKISDLKNQLMAMVIALKYRPHTSVRKFIDILAKKFNIECNLLSVELETIFREVGGDAEDTIQAFLDKMANHSDAAFLALQFEKYVKQVPDNQHAVAEFIEVIDVSCFNGLGSKADILAQFHQIIRDYQYHREALVVCAQAANQGLSAEALHTIKSIDSKPVTIDLLSEHAHHLEQKLIKLDRDYQDNFRHLILHPRLGN